MDTPTNADDRLVDLVDEEIQLKHPAYEIDREACADKFRVQSPVEPCDRCGRRVYLILPTGSDRPRWVQVGELVDADTLFPRVTQIRHECGDGESWSVEAALFVESAMASWAREVS